MASKREWVTTLALVVTATWVAARAFGTVASPATSSAVGAATAPRHFEEWERLLPHARVVAGSEGAEISIVALSDLQCAVCKSFHETAEAVVAEFPQDVNYLHVHLPLEYHPAALPAARLAECVAEHHGAAFSRWVGAVYERQDSLGSRPWGAYLADAEISDTTAILECASRGDVAAEARAGWMFVDELNISGTPAVLVDGWQYLQPPSTPELRAMIRQRLRDLGR